MPGQEVGLAAAVQDGHETIFIHGVQHVHLVKAEGRGGCAGQAGIRHLLVLQKVDDAWWETHHPVPVAHVSRHLLRTIRTQYVIDGHVSCRAGVTHRSSRSAVSRKSALSQKRLKLVSVDVLHI